MPHRINLQSETRTILTLPSGRRDSRLLPSPIASAGSPIISRGGVFLCLDHAGGDFQWGLGTVGCSTKALSRGLRLQSEIREARV